MKRAFPLILLLCCLPLSSCNFLEAMDQTSPHRKGPVPLSDNWFEQRKLTKYLKSIEKDP